MKYYTDDECWELEKRFAEMSYELATMRFLLERIAGWIPFAPIGNPYQEARDLLTAFGYEPLTKEREQMVLIQDDDVL